MTREEAIDILESRSVCMECVISKYDCDACDEAFKMAISALDGIRRLEAEVTEEHNKLYNADTLDEWQQGEHYAYHRVLQMIADMRCEE